MEIIRNKLSQKNIMIYIRNCDKDVPHSFVKPDGGYPMWSMTSAPTHLPLDQDSGDPADDNLQSMMLKDNILELAIFP